MEKKKVLSLITAICLMINVTGCSKKIDDEEMRDLCRDNLLKSINNSLIEDPSSVAYKLDEMGIKVEEMENDFIYYYENNNMNECNDILYLLSSNELKILIANMYNVSSDEISELKVTRNDNDDGYITKYTLDNCNYSVYSSNYLFDVVYVSSLHQLGFSDGVLNLYDGYNIVKEGLMLEGKFLDDDIIINGEEYNGCLNLGVDEKSYTEVKNNVSDYKINSLLNDPKRILK